MPILCCGVFLLAGVFAIALAMGGSKRKAAYEAALSALGASPRDERLRQAALEAGRIYYSAKTGRFGTHASTETAVANDIAARIGSAPDRAESQAAAYCSKCGSPIQEDAAFCPKCGAAVVA